MAKKAKTASHRWVGGNTAIPAHYGWSEQLAATTELLQAKIITVDLFALREESEKPPTLLAPLVSTTKLRVGESVSVDVVVANRGVGHSFPAELRDIFEAWLEFQATDANGQVLLHSGAVRADGYLEWNAHAYRAIPIDDDGRMITRHDIWNTRVTALDRHIPAGRADCASFNLAIPQDAQSPITLTARLNYRRFNRRFTDWVSREVAVGLAPVVEMAEAQITLEVSRIGAMENPQPLNASKADYARWRSYGVALFDQQQYERAAQAFKQALALAAKGSTEELSSNIDLALTYLKMERLRDSQSILDGAQQLLGRALEISPNDGWARFYRALLSVKRFRFTEALTDFESLAHEYPLDRQVWSQLAALYLLQRRDHEALSAYQRVLQIDADDSEAHLKLAGLYWRFGMIEQAKAAQSAYQARLPDSVGETLRRSFLRDHADFYATWQWREFGDNPIGSN